MSATQEHLYFRTWEALFFGDLSVEEAARKLEVPPERVETYMDSLRANLSGAIENIFPRIQKWILLSPPNRTNSANGEVEWESLVSRYYKKHPPTSQERRRIVQAFPEFLSQDGAPLPLVELAQLEWAEYDAFVDAGDETQATAQFCKDGIGLSPCLRIFSFQHQITDWLNALDKVPLEGNGTTIPNAEAQPQQVAVSRATQPWRATMTNLSPLGAAVILGLVECGSRAYGEHVALTAQTVRATEHVVGEEIEFLLRQGVLLKAAPSSEARRQ